MSTLTRPAPVAGDIEYDSKIVWELFAHNKNSTLDYGWIRNKVLRSNAKMSNDRQNAALDHLEKHGMILKVSHGRWRYLKPERPSAAVVASAPATPDEAAQVIPRFPGATSDLSYAALRAALPNGMTSPQLYEALGLQNVEEKRNCSASLASLEKMGWLDVDRTTPKKYIFFARTTNKLGKPAKGLRHASAPVMSTNGQAPVLPVERLDPAGSSDRARTTSPAAATSPPATSQAVEQAPKAPRTFTLAEVRRHSDLVAERATIMAQIDAFYEARLGRLKAIDDELKSYEA